MMERRICLMVYYIYFHILIMNENEVEKMMENYLFNGVVHIFPYINDD